MSPPQKRLRPTTYSHRQALARMKAHPRLTMQCGDVQWSYTGTVFKHRIPGSTPWTEIEGKPKFRKDQRWFDAIPQPK